MSASTSTFMLGGSSAVGVAWGAPAGGGGLSGSGVASAGVVVGVVGIDEALVFTKKFIELIY